jgi:hypothetical protein
MQDGFFAAICRRAVCWNERSQLLFFSFERVPRWNVALNHADLTLVESDRLHNDAKTTVNQIDVRHVRISRVGFLWHEVSLVDAVDVKPTAIGLQ